MKFKSVGIITRSQDDSITESIHQLLIILNEYKCDVIISKKSSIDNAIQINENEILIAQSKDNGSPFIAGSVSFNKFLFGKNSFNKHIEYLIDKKYAYKQIFSTEFTFELDDEEDYKKFIQNQPRWFRKLNA